MINRSVKDKLERLNDPPDLGSTCVSINRVHCLDMTNSDLGA